MVLLRTHYDNLKVSRDAPDSVIRAAYRTLSQQYHPDKRPGDARAAAVMSLINQSYEILSDPNRRREHDSWIAREELRRAQRTHSEAPPIPPQWKQPAPSRAPSLQGNLLATALLWPLRTVIRVARAVPQLTMLALLIGGIWIWDAVTPDRPPPPPRPGPKPYQATAPAKLPDVAISDCRKVSSIKGQGGRETAIYTYVENGTRHYASKLPPACQRTGQGPGAPAPVTAAAYFRPDHAPNDTPWPKRAEYLARYSIDNNDGHSNVTVDNTRNDSDVFAKLVSLNGDIARPVRHFFIPAGSRFTMDQVTAGGYDIRYRDLESGALTRSEPFDVEERRTAEGIEYSEMTMTLYKVANGNFQTYDLAEEEF